MLTFSLFKVLSLAIAVCLIRAQTDNSPLMEEQRLALNTVLDTLGVKTFTCSSLRRLLTFPSFKCVHQRLVLLTLKNFNHAHPRWARRLVSLALVAMSRPCVSCCSFTRRFLFSHPFLNRVIINRSLNGGIATEIGKLTALTSLFVNELFVSVAWASFDFLTQIFEHKFADRHIAERAWPADVVAVFVSPQCPVDFVCRLTVIFNRYLDDNRFTGEIPSNLGQLTRLLVL
jgi:hypothetical protein